VCLCVWTYVCEYMHVCASTPAHSFAQNLPRLLLSTRAARTEARSRFEPACNHLSKRPPFEASSLGGAVCLCGVMFVWCDAFDLFLFFFFAGLRSILPNFVGNDARQHAREWSDWKRGVDQRRSAALVSAFVHHSHVPDLVELHHRHYRSVSVGGRDTSTRRHWTRRVQLEAPYGTYPVCPPTRRTLYAVQALGRIQRTLYAAYNARCMLCKQ
jgi:hypothetical protein